MLAMTVPLQYAQRGSHLALAALAGRRRFEPLVHHPRRDVRDPEHGTRFYYHAHALPGDSPKEHGHFHLFHEQARGFIHLAALSLDAQGRPLRWFCTNQWVTGEHWRSARAWAGTVGQFRLQTQGRMAPVARWLEAMVQLYGEELLALLQTRDAVVQGLASSASQRRRLFADRQHHILCSLPVSLQDKVSRLL